MDTDRGSELAREQPRGFEVEDPADVHLAKFGAAQTANAAAADLATGRRSQRLQPDAPATVRQPSQGTAASSGGSTASRQRAASTKSSLRSPADDLNELADGDTVSLDGSQASKQRTGMTRAISRRPPAVELEELAGGDAVSSGGLMTSKQQTGAVKSGLQEQDTALDELAADTRYSSLPDSLPRQDTLRQDPAADPMNSMHPNDSRRISGKEPMANSASASSKAAQPKRRFGAGVNPADLGLQQLSSSTEQPSRQAALPRSSSAGRQAVPGMDEELGTSPSSRQVVTRWPADDEGELGEEPPKTPASQVSKGLPGAATVKGNQASSASRASPASKATSGGSLPAGAVQKVPVSRPLILQADAAEEDADFADEVPGSAASLPGRSSASGATAASAANASANAIHAPPIFKPLSSQADTAKDEFADELPGRASTLPAAKSRSAPDQASVGAAEVLPTSKLPAGKPAAASSLIPQQQASDAAKDQDILPGGALDRASVGQMPHSAASKHEGMDVAGTDEAAAGLLPVDTLPGRDPMHEAAMDRGVGQQAPEDTAARPEALHEADLDEAATGLLPTTKKADRAERSSLADPALADALSAAKENHRVSHPDPHHTPGSQDSQDLSMKQHVPFELGELLAGNGHPPPPPSSSL